MPRESGRSVRGRPRIGHAGNARLRTALYMATLRAAQHNPAIKRCYDRLRAAGKPVKVVDLIRFHGRVTIRRRLFGGTSPHTRAGCGS